MARAKYISIVKRYINDDNYIFLSGTVEELKVNKIIKTFKDTFVKVTESVPRAHAKINLKELFAQAMKIIKATKK